MRTTERKALLTGALVAVMACGACGTDGEAVPAVAGPSHAWALDGDGDPVDGDLPLTFSGAYQLGAEAVSFDGATGSAETSASGPVETTDSFSVAAWVSLNPPALPGGAEFVTAVSQLGDEAAAFYLGVADGVWAFSMKDADTNEPGHTIRAVSGVATPDDEAWVHLVGVHDADEGRLHFYVDGEPAGEADFAGAWQADGPLTVGRSQAHGAAEGFWPGAVADVRIFASALDDPAVRELADATAPDAAPPPQPSTAPTALPDGTYEYTFTPEEAAQVIAVGFSPEEAEQAGYPGVLSTSLQFAEGQWQQSFSVDGVVYLVGGRPEGDGGTFTVSGDRLVLSNAGGDAVYGWTIDADVLSLRILELGDPGETPVVRLITEHDYRLVVA
jgi:hypothetical protein